MAVSLISYENKMNSGTLTVPAGTTMIVTLSRNTTTPTLNSISFSTAYSYSTGNISIHYMNNPPIGTYNYTAGGYEMVVWCYLSGTNGVLDTDYGSAYDAALSRTLTSVAGGMCLAVMRGTIGTSPLIITINGSTATYVDANKRAGYGAATGSTCVCTAEDPSAGTPTTYGVFISIDVAASGGCQTMWWN